MTRKLEKFIQVTSVVVALILGFLYSTCKGQETRPRIVANTPNIGFRIHEMRISSLPREVTEIIICFKTLSSDVDVMFMFRNEQVFYFERTDIFGTIAIAKTPFVLLQLQYDGIKTESMSKIEEKDRPYVLRFVNQEVKIFQEKKDLAQLEKVLNLLQEEFLPLNYEKLKILDSKKLTKGLLFIPIPDWLWINDDQADQISALSPSASPPRGFYIKNRVACYSARHGRDFMGDKITDSQGEVQVHEVSSPS